MTFRTRILVACLLAAVAPLVVFALGARNEVRDRLSAQFEARVAATSAVIQQDLTRHATALDARLAALVSRVDGDATLRAALLRGETSDVVVDHAAGMMRATGLDHLLLVDADGVVLSSGHFRLEHGRTLPALPALLATERLALVHARRPEGAFLSLARAHAFTIGGRRFALVGGVEVDEAFVHALARGEGGTLVVALEHPGGRLVSAADDDAARALHAPDSHRERIVLPFVDDIAGATEAGTAEWTIAQSRAPLRALLRRMDRWFGAAVALAIVLAFVVARLLAARVNRPLEELAQRSTRIYLDRPGGDFATARRDEVGTLSRMLDAMIKRLRASVAALRDAERRATVGDMARQVNHDIRNGLLPIRNVVRHLSEVAHAEPAALAGVFAEREGTLHGGIGYLESLAGNYARLTPPSERQPCDINVAVREAMRDAPGEHGVRIRFDLDGAAPRVLADPIALRRVLENLAVNAVESLDGSDGDVVARTRVRDGHVIITIADSGGGIASDALDRVFDDFYTTKARGTGLGLSIVRRLVTDMGGRIRVESEVGRGTSFHIELPAVS
jgi:two-component system, NtrC family, nitrogen regulation sensor histidine kinase NtrY